MPTVLTHAVSGIALESAFRRPLGTARVWLAGAVCASLPDVDVIGFGFGIQSPFSNARYFFPVRPIRVSPIGIGAFVAGDLLAVLTSEVRCVWLPSALFMAVAWLRASVKGEGDADRTSESRGRWR